MEDPAKDRQRMAAQIKESIRRHHRVLNQLEPHLGCVVCRGPLTDGVCPTCDDEAQELRAEIDRLRNIIAPPCVCGHSGMVHVQADGGGNCDDCACREYQPH